MPERAVPPLPAYPDRVAFVVELAEHLHAYGTTVQRLEGAIDSVARRLSLFMRNWAGGPSVVGRRPTESQMGRPAISVQLI